jgi:AraC-like DNA-binding protein
MDTSPGFFDMHYELEVGIVFSGKVIRKYQGYEMALEPGQVWMGGVWEPHGFQVTEATCEMLVFMVYPEFLAKTDQPGFNWIELFSMPVDRRPQIQDKHLPEIMNICRKVKETVESRKEEGGADCLPGMMLWRKLLLLQVLLYLTEGREEMFSANNNLEMRQYIELQPCMQMIYHSRKLVSIEEAARACALSPSQFSKLFRKLMGIPFSKFALRYRIKEAARQLIETDEPIKYIAVRWGFADASHFYNCFMDHYAISPKEYRALHKTGS